jgi:hypothetical protein
MDDEESEERSVHVSSDLKELLDLVIAALPADGNKEVMLYHEGDGRWRAEAVNSSAMVWLGETIGDYTAYGKSPEEVLQTLLDKVKDNA